MSKIVIIAPSKEFADTIRSVVDERRFKIYAPEGDRDFSFEETIPIAKHEERLGAQVIVTRGGQATLLKQIVSIPVVEVKMTILDILRTVHTLKTRYRRIGLIGVENIICDYRELGSYIDIQIYPVFSYEQDLDARVQQALADQVEFVVGDGMSIDYAKRFGLFGIKLMPSSASVQEAIELAENLVRARFLEGTKNEQFRMVLETAQDAILIISEDAHVLLANQRAIHLLQQDRADIIHRPIDDVLKREPSLLQLVDQSQEFREEIVHVRNFVLSVSKRRIMVAENPIGWVLTLQDVTQIQKLEQSIRRKLNHTGFVARRRLDDLTAVSPTMQNVIEKIKHFSQTDSTALLLGETGTGKELIAQSIHNHSARKNRPFVPINCGALPGNLLESELFGYEPGAFTGANRNGKAGLFELAHTGTIFLDEIGEIPLELQSRLLRVIQEREVMRVGGSSIIPIDVRIIAATHRNLQADVRCGRFRADLFYRLHILPIPIPPLRARREDIPSLVDALLAKTCERYRCVTPRLPTRFIEQLTNYDWPGNIRELENVLERIVVLLTAGMPETDVLGEIAAELTAEQDTAALTPEPPHTEDSRCALDGTLEDIERRVILQQLARFGGNKELTAKRLGISRATLWRKLKENE
ncbi:sigma 54-interacting transcriptional regulator [Alicyclobacillus fastidiosus]|uniref:Sigma 54-interacting transcriptional regulator n=1 Tax=Alicyclobacillus fastidiosus TaxID=392011 RepID=A0ABV5AEN1_9BACL|nr:sigma 54-interacting transcriptional regulator [Alicyclobacillus fastidiosus]WEH09783.1 sigma 54-interacting transcriptional regulator [Alicyclobacillus fastidiosus]